MKTLAEKTLFIVKVLTWNLNDGECPDPMVREALDKIKEQSRVNKQSMGQQEAWQKAAQSWLIEWASANPMIGDADRVVIENIYNSRVTVDMPSVRIEVLAKLIGISNIPLARS